MNSISSKLIVALGVSAALAAPSAAFAQHGADDGAASGGDHATEVETEHSTAPATRTETYDLRGTVVSADPASNTVVITVTRANHGRRGRALIGTNVTLDLSGIRVRIADANGDGTADLNDVAPGDRAEARVQLPRSGASLSQPVHAQRFRDRGAAR